VRADEVRQSNRSSQGPPPPGRGGPRPDDRLRDDRPTAPHRLMTAWRAEALGQPLLDLVAGLGEYTFGWSDGRLRVG
jgi:hypothetical protein